MNGIEVVDVCIDVIGYYIYDVCNIQIYADASVAKIIKKCRNDSCLYRNTY